MLVVGIERTPEHLSLREYGTYVPEEFRLSADYYVGLHRLGTKLGTGVEFKRNSLFPESFPFFESAVSRHFSITCFGFLSEDTEHMFWWADFVDFGGLLLAISGNTNKC